MLCADCIGLIKGFVWTNGGENVLESIGKPEQLFKNVYCSHGMPDKSANGMYNYAKSIGLDNGDISTIPEIPGLGLHKDGHAGVYIGNGLVVEERGGTYGCVISKLNERPWLHWYKIPVIDYGDGAAVTPAKPSETTIKLGARTLKNGMSGDDVKELQKLLNKVMKSNLSEDGKFGPATMAAVQAFQAKYGQTVDGVYGPKTHAALMSAVGDQTAPIVEPEPEPTPAPATGTTIKTTGNVHIRCGDGTQYDILTTVSIDTILKPVVGQDKKPLISANGWYAVECNGAIGWVSGKYIG